MRGYRFALRPGWLAFTVLCIALIVTMVLLGRWQLDVSNRKHFSLQNFGYALQWWAFSIFTGVMWVRVVRDRHRRAGMPAGTAAAPAQRSPGEPAYRRYVMPSAQAQQPATDPTLAAYNAYLAELARRDAAR